MKQKVVIIGRGYNNRLALVRSLGELGYEISIVVLEHLKKPVDSYSKYVAHCYLCPKETEEDLISVLLTNCIDEKQKVILIPSNDFSVYVLDKNYNKLEKHFMFPTVNRKQGAIVKWMNKDLQKAHAVKCGLNVVDSKTIEIYKKSYNVPVGIKYPCFTKTQSYIKRGKGFLRKCNNEAELLKVLDAICEQQDKVALMIENYIEIDREFSVGGFSDGYNIVIGGVVEKQTISNGVTLTGRIVPISGYENLVEKFKFFIRDIGFRGVFDIDFFRSGNEFYFCELNYRYGGTGFAYIKNNVNYPGMLVKTLLGDSLDGMKKEINSSSTFINEYACLMDWYRGDMTTKKFWQFFNNADFVLIADDRDPVPEHSFMKFYMKMRIKRILKILSLFFMKQYER